MVYGTWIWNETLIWIAILTWTATCILQGYPRLPRALPYYVQRERSSLRRLGRSEARVLLQAQHIYAAQSMPGSPPLLAHPVVDWERQQEDGRKIGQAASSYDKDQLLWHGGPRLRPCRRKYSSGGRIQAPQVNPEHSRNTTCRLLGDEDKNGNGHRGIHPLLLESLR